MFFRSSIERQPRRQPQKTERARKDEGRAPAPSVGDCAHDERRDERANVCAGVKDSGRECTFFLRKPLGHSLDRRRKISGFAEAQKKASNAETKHTARERVAHRRNAPEDDRERKALARSDAI